MLEVDTSPLLTVAVVAVFVLVAAVSSVGAPVEAVASNITCALSLVLVLSALVPQLHNSSDDTITRHISITVTLKPLRVIIVFLMICVCMVYFLICFAAQKSDSARKLMTTIISVLFLNCACVVLISYP